MLKIPGVCGSVHSHRVRGCSYGNNPCQIQERISEMQSKTISAFEADYQHSSSLF